MELGGAFRQALIEGSAADLRRLWAAAFAHLPQPRNDEEAAVMLHRARTQAESVPFRLRAWSHAWLLERGIPSGLPDHLRPRAQRIYPVSAEGVGISVKSLSGHGKERAKLIQTAMSDAVAEMYDSGVRDVARIKARMAEVKDWAKRKY